MAAAVDKSHWEEDATAINCRNCNAAFALTLRRHHCRECGKIFCDDCCFLRSPCSKSQEPARLCEKCALETSKARLGIELDESTMEHVEEIEVEVNQEDTFENIVVGGPESHHALQGKANSRINMKNCIIYGIKKGSNGHVKLDHCIVFGEDAIEIGGNNSLDLHHTIVLGADTGIELSANAHMEARDSVIFATGKPQHDSLAMNMSGNAKADLHNCIVCGKDGVVTRANAIAKFKSGVVASQAAAIAFVDSRSAIAGKHELHGAKVIGKVSERPGQKSAMQQMADKKKAQLKAKANPL